MPALWTGSSSPWNGSGGNLRDLQRRFRDFGDQNFRLEYFGNETGGAPVVGYMPTVYPDDTLTNAEDDPNIMAEPTRDEINAKLETVEARTQTLFVELGGKIDRLTDRIDHDLGALKYEIREVRQDNKSTRRTIIITVVGAVIAALAAAWAAQSNLISAFSVGISVSDHRPSSSAVSGPSSGAVQK